MQTPSCFIGVVSYERSRFAINQGDQGFAAQLRDALTQRGVTASIAINTANLHDPDALPVDEALLQASLTAEIDSAVAWDDYLGRTGTRVRAGHALRRARRAWRRLSPPSPALVTRLLNIELSHIDLMRRGLTEKADWLLIIEDDASTSDLDDCADGLLGLMRTAPAALQFANVSESFPLPALGIEHLLTHVEMPWRGTRNRDILGADRPVTNTVCAILYRADFVRRLLAQFEQLPMTPVLPIDWKLNEALMAMHRRGELGAGSCWLVSPAPIDQLSMRDGAEP